MKIFSLILSLFLLGCIGSPSKAPRDILEKNRFIKILKDMHLADAEFEINKQNNNQDAEKILKNKYQSIYLQLNTNQSQFEKTISYYSNYPEKIELIYSQVLLELTQEKSILNQK